MHVHMHANNLCLETTVGLTAVCLYLKDSKNMYMYMYAVNHNIHYMCTLSYQIYFQTM